MGVIYAFIGCHLDVIYAFIGCHLCDTIFPGKFIYFLLGTKKLIILQQLSFLQQNDIFASIIRKFIKIYQIDVIWMSFMHLPGVIWGLFVHLSDVIWVTQNYTIKWRFPIQLSKKIIKLIIKDRFLLTTSCLSAII